MGTTYERAPKEIETLANEIMCAYGSHKPLLDARVKIDFVFAHGDPATGAPAIKHDGIRALGLCRRIGLKDRALGRGDAEIILDADWWEVATAEQAKALLDHELTHLEVAKDKLGRWDWDDLHRPKLKLRPHDLEFGWFVEMARRHQEASQERIQAKTMLDAAGQWLWPDLVGGAAAESGLPAEETTVELSSGGKSAGPIPLKKFTAAAAEITAAGKKIYRLKKT